MRAGYLTPVGCSRRRAAAAKPFGFVPCSPGAGLGGHCNPIDPFYRAWKARGYDVNTRFIDVPSFPQMREHKFDLTSVVLVTDHDAFDYAVIASHAKLLVDTRGRYPKPESHIVKA